MSTIKFLDPNGLSIVLHKLNAYFVKKEAGKGLTSNDYTTDEKNKLAGIAAGATANTGTITGIKMNGASKGTSGVVDLGTVITDVSNKVDKVSGKGLSTNDYTDEDRAIVRSQNPVTYKGRLVMRIANLRQNNAPYLSDILGDICFPGNGNGEHIYVELSYCGNVGEELGNPNIFNYLIKPCIEAAKSSIGIHIRLTMFSTIQPICTPTEGVYTFGEFEVVKNVLAAGANVKGGGRIVFDIESMSTIDDISIDVTCHSYSVVY